MDNFDIFDTLYSSDEEQEIDPQHSMECCEQTRVYSDREGICICTSCGSFIVSNKPVMECFVVTSTKRKYRSIYKPNVHFMHKIREIRGLLVPETDHMDIFKGSTIKSIFDVRKILKSNRLSHLNRYSYYYFEQITGRPVFNLSRQNVRQMCSKFATIHRSFRGCSKRFSRSNLPNFHSILLILLQHMNIDTTDKLFVPKLKSTTIKNTELFKQLNHCLNAPTS